MNILFATTEAVPFCKTGGLGDVCGALPVELAKLGHRPMLVMPAFRQVYESGQPLEEMDVEIEVEIAGTPVHGGLVKSYLPDSDVPVYLIEQHDYYNRPSLYFENGEDYKDNCERFVFFSRAVLEVIEQVAPETELVHGHDWPAGLVPIYLQTQSSHHVAFDQIASLFTIHNLAYQGNFWHWDMELTGLDWKYFNWQQMEFYGQLNFLKTGLAFADVLSTVSPRYAQEIQTPEQGNGLDGLLRHRSEDLYGVLNGVDYREWDPATDRFLPQNYDVETFTTGKAACKAALQRELGLPERADLPLFVAVSRLADQKGFDLLAPLLESYATRGNTQWAILGTGDPRYHRLLADLAGRFPQQLAVRLEFSNALAHRMEAGGDIFVMPSRYEPCGLNQMYSLRYGAVPLVRETGGLADTIVNASHEALFHATANGFSFVDYTVEALASTIERALASYANPDEWRQIVMRGMQQDLSWNASARRYDELYRHTLARRASLV